MKMPRSLTLTDVINRLKRQIGTAGGVSAWAREQGLTTSFVYAVLNGRRVPTQAICKPLGLRIERKITVRYVEDDNG